MDQPKPPVHPASGSQLSLLRVNLLRIVYAIMAIGIAVFFWPNIFSHSAEFAATSGIPASLLAGLGLVAALGLLYPLEMLPIVLFEFVWKTIYLIAFVLPLWISGKPISAAMTSDIISVLMVALFIPLVPWRYLVTHYIVGRPARWR